MRTLAGRKVNPLGLGCMNLSHAYNVPPTSEVGRALIHRALDLGIDHFDTAALYGFGRNETLVGDALKGVRDKVLLASKCGMTGVDGKRVIDNRPETLIQTCDDALRRLQTDHIDLYYLHRWDKAVPIEEPVGQLGRLVEAGKIGAVGLSEVSAATLKLAHIEYPISAVQTEYSLWSRNAEITIIKACQDIGAAFVAFSPLGRGFLAGSVTHTDFAERDVRLPMPRFQPPNFIKNLEWFWDFKALAERHDLTPAQLSLGWLLSRGDHIHAIPGTTNADHMWENSVAVTVSPAVLAEAETIINAKTVWGGRYPDAVQAEIDTEEFVHAATT